MNRIHLLRSFLVAFVACGLGLHVTVEPAVAQHVADHGGSPTSVQSRLSVRSVSPAIQDRVQAAIRGDDLSGKDGPMAKIGAKLATLYYQNEADGPSGVKRLMGSEKQYRQTSRARYYSPVAEDGRYVSIDAIASNGTSRLLADLRRLGLQKGATAGNVVSGQLPISALKEAAQLSSLRGALPASYRTHVGSVESEADTAHSAYQGRANLSVDGSGLKVCALSDSYNQNASASTSAPDDTTSYDLPGASGHPAGNTTPVDNLDDSVPASDEGRAMLQLIHDIAPGAELGFHTAAGGLGVFVSGIRKLADPNGGDCDIIVDDIGYNIEPFYQDGPVSNVVDSVVAEGIPYFSSAGNDGQNSYEAPFRNSGNPGVISSSAEAHDFDPSTNVDTLQEISIQEGGEFGFFTFQWTDPSAVVSGSAGPDTDLDVALVNDTLGVVAESSLDSDNIGLPFESLRFTNSDPDTTDANGDSVADTTFHLVIEKATGPDPSEVKYIYSGSDYQIEEYDTLGPTIYGHPMAEGAMAVAAAPFFNTAAYNPNSDPATLESFSSKGGISIRFDQNGNELGAYETRGKPDVTGTDGIDNTFFGFDIGLVDPDSDPNFFGTSAAAPNIAAVAALILEANPGYAPADLYNHLATNAEDVNERQTRNGNFVPVATGEDPWSGHGFVQATSSALPVDLASFDAVATDDGARLNWTTASETNNAGFSVEHKYEDGSFEEVAYKEGAGTTSESHSYRFSTSDLEVGRHTFRLKQVDVDGSSAYSKEVTIEATLSSEYSVTAMSPNPVKTTGTVSVTVREAQEVQAAVYNVLGQRVAMLHDGTLPAEDPTTLTVGSSLPSGVYFLRVDGESFSTTQKFVRVR